MKKNLFIKDSKGMTIVEMVLAITISVVLLGIISTIVIQSFYVNRYSIEQGINLSSLQTTLRSFSTNMREAKQSDAGGFMLESADDFELIFYSNIDDDEKTERLHYYLENSQLKLGISEATGFPMTYPEDDEEIRDVGFGIVNTNEQPIFYYFGGRLPIHQRRAFGNTSQPREYYLGKNRHLR